MAKTYKQLSVEERDRIALLKGQGLSVRGIARALGRNEGTISRELKRNSGQVYANCYLAHRAQMRADQRKIRNHGLKRLADPQLRAFIGRQIRRGWSPERIAGRWRLLGRGQVSHEAIYQWIYSKAQQLAPLLPKAHRRRKRLGHSSKHKSFFIPSRNPVSQRPKWIDKRLQAGHWEADTIIGRHSLSALQIAVERKTRFARLNKLRGKFAEDMRRMLNRTLSQYPKHMRRTITYDNGRENVQHLLVNARLGTKSYFCEKMHSWEKGSVENAAGLVRRHLPKRTDFATVSNEQVKRVERWLNSLPKKCLGFRTPAEAFRASVALAG